MTNTTEYKGPSNIGVTRWNAQIEHYYKNPRGRSCYRPKMMPNTTGKYVLARDYADLKQEYDKVVSTVSELMARIQTGEE